MSVKNAESASTDNHIRIKLELRLIGKCFLPGCEYSLTPHRSVYRFSVPGGNLFSFYLFYNRNR